MLTGRRPTEASFQSLAGIPRTLHLLYRTLDFENRSQDIQTQSQDCQLVFVPINSAGSFHKWQTVSPDLSWTKMMIPQ